MNDKEIATYNALVELITPYSEELPQDTKQAILTQVNHLSCVEVELYDLDTYWSASSLEVFCRMLAVERQLPGVLSEGEIYNAVKRIYAAKEDPDTFDYYLEKYSAAIEYHFTSSTGSLYEAMMADENDSLDKVIDFLFKNGAICL